jgi:hypothetical protein
MELDPLKFFLCFATKIIYESVLVKKFNLSKIFLYSLFEFAVQARREFLSRCAGSLFAMCVMNMS